MDERRIHNFCIIAHRDRALVIAHKSLFHRRGAEDAEKTCNALRSQRLGGEMWGITSDRATLTPADQFGVGR